LNLGKPIARAVFLDRDGVINRAIVRDGRPFPPSSMDELEILDGVPEALAQLKAAGFVLLVVTNQPDVATGRAERSFVEAVHRHMAAELPIDRFYACYHGPEDDCACRKPQPGMLLQAASEHHLDLTASSIVGDRWRDIEAGRAVGCTTFFVDRGYREQQPEQVDYRVKDLSEAAGIIISRSGHDCS
jgi:D-glycero-D-manno-heptose 1,7-bisphosphate phosphatase